jgi:hypothetical protein
VTAIGWLIILALIGFFSLITIKLVPVYSEYMSVSSSLENLAKEGSLSQLGKAEILRRIDANFNINSITTVKARDVQIVKKSGSIELIADYEVRKHLFGNIDIVVHFVKSVQG